MSFRDLKLTKVVNLLLHLCKMCDCKPNSIDLKTPRNTYLTAFYKRSFAHHTVKVRMPVILTKIVDGLARRKEEIGEKYGQQGQEELKAVIGEISKLKYEIQTNKPLRKLISNASDVAFYNKYLESQFNKEGNVTYFSTIWLLSECYMYRRVREAFELTNTLRNYDPFTTDKQDAYFNALSTITSLSHHLTTVLEQSAEPNKEDFIKLLKINLWGNKCDLSISAGREESNSQDLFDVAVLDSQILCDHSKKIWSILSNRPSKIIDIICDNSGYELFTDLCLADYLISKKLAAKVRFNVKSIPWFISDVMPNDFHWTLDHLSNNEDQKLKDLGKKWSNYVKEKIWILDVHDFWTLPVDFTYMANADPALYKKLAEADLLIFKGDLNYRKLFGEKNWIPSTAVDEALQNFHPSKLCTLRTIKADIVCGLRQGLAEELDAKDEKWMESGDYGLIQCSEKVVTI